MGHYFHDTQYVGMNRMLYSFTVYLAARQRKSFSDFGIEEIMQEKKNTYKSGESEGISIISFISASFSF